MIRARLCNNYVFFRKREREREDESISFCWNVVKGVKGDDFKKTKNFGLSIDVAITIIVFFKLYHNCLNDLTSTLEESQSLPQHFLTFLQGVFVGDVLFLSLRQSLAEVGGFFQNHHLSCPICRFQIGNQWTKEFESVAKIDSSLTFHRIVLGAFFTAVFRVARCSGTPFARRARAAFTRRTRSFATTTAPFATIFPAHFQFTWFFRRRHRWWWGCRVWMFSLLSGRCDDQLQMLSDRSRWIRRKSFAHQHLSGSRRRRWRRRIDSSWRSSRCNCKVEIQKKRPVILSDGRRASKSGTRGTRHKLTASSSQSNIYFPSFLPSFFFLLLLTVREQPTSHRDSLDCLDGKSPTLPEWTYLLIWVWAGRDCY